MPLHLPLSQSFPNSPPGQMLAGSWLYMPREKYTLPTSVNTPRAPLIFLKEAWESLAKAGRAVFYTSEASDENTDCSTDLTQGMPQGSQLLRAVRVSKALLGSSAGTHSYCSNSWHGDVPNTLQNRVLPAWAWRRRWQTSQTRVAKLHPLSCSVEDAERTTQALSLS